MAASTSMARTGSKSSSEAEQATISVMSLLEPRKAPRDFTNTFIQFYTGEFLCDEEVQKATHKRAHSFNHRTYAHDLYQSPQEGTATGGHHPVEEAYHRVNIGSKTEETASSRQCENSARDKRKARKAKYESTMCLERDRKMSRDEGQASAQQTIATEVAESTCASIAEDKGCTIVLRNIPKSVSQKQLFEVLVDHGFEDDVVLLYMPWLMGRSEQANLGYAFVHLQSLAAKQALAEIWQGKYPFGWEPAARPINIAFASIQGAKANLERWNASKKMARIRNASFRPMVLKQLD